MHVHGDRRHRFMSLAKCLEELQAARRMLLLELVVLDVRTKAIQLEHSMLHNLIDASTSNLPDEVLAMVFEAGEGVEPDRALWLKTKSFKYNPFEHSSAAHFEKVVSHVSHHWRSVALATPKLWTYINCTRINNMNGGHSWHERNGWKERAAEYLCRSRSSPVDIYIKGLRVEHFTPYFVHLITAHLGHCRQLFIRDVTKEVVPFLLQSLSTPAPLMSSFRIGLEGHGLDIEFEDPGFLQFGAPCLVTADLHGIHPPRLLPVFASVTSLRITGTCIDARTSYYALLRDSLMGLKSLNHLEIQFRHYYRPPTANAIVLPTVQFLHVDVMEDMSPSFVNHFLDDIQAPSLISLSLNKWDVDHPDPLEPNRFPLLIHLILYDCNRGMNVADLDNLAKLARQFPNITQFTSQANIEEPCSLAIILRTMLDERSDDYDEDVEADDENEDIESNDDEDIESNGEDEEDEDIESNDEEEDEEDSESDRTSWPNSPWPNLKIIAVADPIDTLHSFMDIVDLRMVAGLLKCLKDEGHPLCKLLVSNKAVSKTDEDIMEELRKLIEIEDFMEDWPTPFERGR